MSKASPPNVSLDYDTDDLHLALKKVHLALIRLHIKYAVIGAAALAFYSEHYNVVFRDHTTCIDILIQPSPKLASEDITTILCTESSFAEDFRAVKRFGPKQVQVVARLGEGEERDVLFGLRIYDHWTFSEKCVEYDLSRWGNERISITNQGWKIYLMNSCWLLRQKICLWAQPGRHRKRDDKNDIVTLSDILQRQKMRLKLKYGKERDRRDLETLLGGWGDDWMILRKAIECPEILGPSKEVWWVDFGVKVLVLVLVLLLWEEWSSDPEEGREKAETLGEILCSLGK